MSGEEGRRGPSFEGEVLAGRWQVGPRIGAGGMATVYEGVDHRLGRRVACKILHPHIADIPEARERLAREARAIAQLKHENVIEVYDYAIDDPDCTWLVTELIEGCTLRQFQDRHDTPMPEVGVMIVTEVVRALRAAHEVGVIHRDVKPDNILVGKTGRPKLSDFGIAKVLNESRMTMTGNLVGSPSYMSPEQADGLHTDHRTDLFSVGILLYRLVTGTVPFRGATPLETIRLVSRGEYTDPADLAPQSAGAVAGIIRRALTLEIDERYQSADELLVDLVQVLQDAGLSATSEELPKYFADPKGYEAAIKPKLAGELEVRGKALLESGEEGRAVDCFNRALALGDGDQRTFDLVEQLSKRRQRGRVRRTLWTAGVAAGAAGLIAAGIIAIDLLSTPQPAPAMASTPHGEGEAPAGASASEAARGIGVGSDGRSERGVGADGRAEFAAGSERGAGGVGSDGRAELAAGSERAAGGVGSGGVGSDGRAELAAGSERGAGGVGSGGVESARSEQRGGSAEVRSAGARAGATERRRGRRGARATSRAGATDVEDKASTSSEGSATKREARPSPSGAALETPKYGTLHVGSAVWVDLFIDDHRVGRVPEKSRYPLPPGDYRLRAVKPNSNCLAFERAFTIRPGETTRLRLNVICP